MILFYLIAYIIIMCCSISPSPILSVTIVAKKMMWKCTIVFKLMNAIWLQYKYNWYQTTAKTRDIGHSFWSTYDFLTILLILVSIIFMTWWRKSRETIWSVFGVILQCKYIMYYSTGAPVSPQHVYQSKIKFYTDEYRICLGEMNIFIVFITSFWHHK